jgi:cell wall-associated NlpC family hydrolase
LEQTTAEFAHIQAHKNGWMSLSALAALSELPKSVAERRSAVGPLARRMMGVPYLWGGCTGNGIDCSGFSRLVHRWLGLEIPRDADMQHAVAKPIAHSFEPGDLLFFSEREDGGRGITHVGISLGGWKIIHSSRSNNGVAIDDVQKNQFLRSIFVSAGTFIA